MVTKCTGNLSQLPGVKMNWGKNLRKNLMIWPTFIFWSISSDTLVAWLPQVDRYTGSLSQLQVAKMTWGEKSKKNKCSDQHSSSGLFHQTHWSHGDHRSAGTQVVYLFWSTFVFWLISSDTLVSSLLKWKMTTWKYDCRSINPIFAVQ